MESSLNYKPERVGSVTVEDLRKDLFTEFAKIPASQQPVLAEREHLQVYLRIRPLTARESEFGESQDCISVEPPDTVVLKAPRLSLTARQSEKLGPQIAQRFQFSKVYGPETTQRQMFDGTTKALAKDVLAGENSLVFTYGVTNAGKTFTFLGPESDGGILPRSLNVIFNSIVGRVYTQNNIKPHRCVDFTRLTKDQQEEEAKMKKTLLRRFKEGDLQKSSSSMSSSACSTLLEGSSYGELDEDGLCLEDDSDVKFSVWVSFCEIYNENIHDLLDFVSNTSHRRSVLRLCQDVKGNTFVKDLTWVQVNSADEAYRVLKIGKRNQSFSSTKLNSVSSRSHSIFSIRILRIEDMGVPRVQTISELSLCDLAGSERCAKTQNRGDRLKEAGNINTSLLTLGKCMNALRLSQTHSKFQQHIPFRESKLTHYLQGFFCGRGKACMIVNINQSASMYDETLNVLKFSAVAQKVVVLNPKPVLSVVPKKSSREVSMMINNVHKREWTRRSTLIGWETSLEDVQEDEDDEEMEVDEKEEEDSCEEIMLGKTVLEAGEDEELVECSFQLQQKIKELNEELSKEQSEKLAMESRIREEVTTEFMELFSNMEKDYNERLQREKEIAEERAERRLEILKDLVNKNGSEMASRNSAENETKETRMSLLDGMIEEMQHDLAKIKRDAEAAQSCLESKAHSPGAVSKLRTHLDKMAEGLLKNHQLLDNKTKEMEKVLVCLQNSSELLEANKNYENQKLRNEQLMEICQEKDEMISKLQTALDQNVEAANEDRAYIDTVKEEILRYRNNCKCMLSDAGEKTTDHEIQQLTESIKEKNDSLAELKHEQQSLEQKIKDLTEDLKKQAQARETAFSLIETEKATTTKLTNENRALASELGAFHQAANDMKSRLTAMEVELSIKTTKAARLSDELEKSQALLQKHEEESTEQSQMIKSLKLEIENLQQRSAKELSEEQTNKCVFQETISSLRRECETMMASSLEKSMRIKALEQEVGQIREEMCQRQTLYDQLEKKQGAQREENRNLLGRIETERLVVEQMKRSYSELEAELHGVAQQLAVLKEQQQVFLQSSERVGELEEKLGEKEAHCGDLEQRLLRTQNKLNQVEERQRLMESSLKERRKEMKDNLIHKNAELEIKAQELLQSQKLVNDGLHTIKRLSLELEQKKKCISDLLSQLNESKSETEQKQEIASLAEEVRTLQQKLCDLEKARDQALAAVTNNEQIIKQLKTDQVHKAQTQHCETCQELLAKEKLTEEMRLTLSEEKRSRTEQAQLLEAKLNEIELLSGELMMLKESCRTKSVSGPNHLHQEEAKIEKTSGHSTQASVHESSVLSTESEREKRFPKPELEISFTPLKPDRLNVRRPGDEESVTVKIKRIARKRKSAEIENSVESENRKNMRLRGNSRANIQRVESPTVLGKKANLLKQKDSPVSGKGRKDGTLQKIGDFIQSSPILLGSKAKKIMAKVALKSPEPQNNTETSEKPKRSKRKLFKTQISSPLDIPSHPIISMDQGDKESDHLIIKRKLRTRTAKM